jgi:LmbE family N-acetylglucosaminyl deacetylase
MKNKTFKSVLEKVIRNKTHCYFISPHLDDAILSAGGFISYLAGKVPVTVINVFTEADRKPCTLSSKAYLSQCGYQDAEELFSLRRKEDEDIFSSLGVEVVNLGFTDAMWRKKEKRNIVLKGLGKLIPELNHVYPTYRFHAGTGKISSYDLKIKAEIKKKLLSQIDLKNSIIFCPVGIGKNVDHILVRDICSNIFNNIIYWSDFNYSMEFSGETKFIHRKKLKVAFFDDELNSKQKLIGSYKSQIYAIFPHGKVPIVPDFFYF